MQIAVQKARSDQSRLLGSRESVSLSADVAESLGIRPGIQVRIENAGDGTAGAYTVRSIHDDGSMPLRMAKRSRKPIGVSAGDTVRIRSTVPRADLGFFEAWRRDDCIETTRHDPTANPDVAFIAPHGGDGERNTDESAVYAAKEYGLSASSTWLVHYFGPKPTSRWHITSTRLHPASFPGLQRLSAHDFSRVVSFHLWNGDEILVGGLADKRIRDALAARLEAATHGCRDVLTEGGKYMGDSEANVVNWLTRDGRSGIQIEAPPYICQRYRKRLGEAVGEFLASR